MTEMSDSEYRKQRLVNMDKLKQLGYPPFGRAFTRTGRLAEIRADCKDGDSVSAAGRLATIRAMGKSVFADLRDCSDRFQIYARRDQMGEASFDAFRLLDIGDHIGVEGEIFTTKTGEKTINVKKWTMLGKALLPLPEKWHGLKDVEARYRQRYLDLIANPEVRGLFARRSAALTEIRAFLIARGFIEVETPILQLQAGGAAARPFATRYDALDCDVYLRIAPELYLKRLLVGGYDKVFELGRNFRNEGLSRSHSPEFTMLEIYEAYSDLRGMKELVEKLVVHLAQTVFGTLRPGTGDSAIDLAPPWREVEYRQLIREKMGADWFELPLDKARDRAAQAGLAIEKDWGATLITHEAYEKLVECSLMQPTFVTRLPAELVPLARQCEDAPSCADVFELVIAGQEIAPAYTELNDPLEQRNRLLDQAGGDASRIDEDFLTALEHGMPPAGGMGLGIDRLLAVLSGSGSIRDVVLFPQLRPKGSGE